jgi:hypothetical protein
LLGNDAAVVERELELPDLAAGKPSGVGGIVSPACFSAHGDRVVKDRDRVPAGIAPRIRVDPADAPDPDLDARLLPHLPGTGLLGRLSHLAEAPRKRPESLERRPAPPDEEDPPAAVAGPGVHRELRAAGSAAPGHGRPS